MAARKTTKKEPQNETTMEVTDINNKQVYVDDVLPDKTNIIEKLESIIDDSDDDYGAVDMEENPLNSDESENDNDENEDFPFADDVYIKDSDITKSKRRGAKPGYIREAIDPDFELKFNLDILQWLNTCTPVPNFPSNEELTELPGIGQHFIRRLRNHGLNLQGDLYKCALIADELGINLIGEKKPGERFCDNALFVKVPRKKSE